MAYLRARRDPGQAALDAGTEALVNREAAAWGFVAPALFALALFFFLPVIAALLLSFTDFDIYAVADLSNLRFADDIVPIAANLGQAQLMLQQLSEEASKVGLKMNLSKTKVMTNIGDDREIKIGDTVIERVDSYVYLGHKLKLGLDNQTAEIRRRIGLAWAAFGKLRLIFKSKMNNSLKRKVFDTCVLPVLTYGAETLTLTKASEEKLRVTQRAMERSMLGITLRDRMTNQWIRQQTRVVDVMERIASLKWSWAGHIARRTDERWTKKIMNWRPYKRRAIGRPPERWTNGIKNIAGTNWQQMAMDRTKWKEVGEAYIQQWIETG